MFKLSNTNGLPIETIGELRELIAPFRDETKITPLLFYYVHMEENNSARLRVEIPDNTVFDLPEEVKKDDAEQPIISDAKKPCGSCDYWQKSGSNFCLNCGNNFLGEGSWDFLR